MTDDSRHYKPYGHTVTQGHVVFHPKADMQIPSCCVNMCILPMEIFTRNPGTSIPVFRGGFVNPEKSVKLAYDYARLWTVYFVFA